MQEIQQKATMLSYSLAFINSFKHQKRKIYQEVRILRYHYEEVWAMVVVFFLSLNDIKKNILRWLTTT